MTSLTTLLDSIPWWLFFIVGFFAGAILMKYVRNVFQVGVIHITEMENGDPDRYLFEFNVEPEDIREHSKVSFNVVNKKSTSK